MGRHIFQGFAPKKKSGVTNLKILINQSKPTGGCINQTGLYPFKNSKTGVVGASVNQPAFKKMTLFATIKPRAKKNMSAILQKYLNLNFTVPKKMGRVEVRNNKP